MEGSLGDVKKICEKKPQGREKTCTKNFGRRRDTNPRPSAWQTSKNLLKLYAKCSSLYAASGSQLMKLKKSVTSLVLKKKSHFYSLHFNTKRADYKNIGDLDLLNSILNYPMVSADSRIFSNLVVQITEAAVDSGRTFLKNVSFFNPGKCLAITHPINLSIHPINLSIDEILSGELILYRENAQEFEPRDATPTSRRDSLEQQLIDIKNFRICNRDVLPNLCELAIDPVLYFSRLNAASAVPTRCLLVNETECHQRPLTCCSFYISILMLN